MMKLPKMKMKMIPNALFFFNHNGNIYQIYKAKHLIWGLEPDLKSWVLFENHNHPHIALLAACNYVIEKGIFIRFILIS